jgi:hypothetical protein
MSAQPEPRPAGSGSLPVKAVQKRKSRPWPEWESPLSAVLFYHQAIPLWRIDMIRVEIIANHSVEENILEALWAEGAGKYYTKYPQVFGVGSAGPRMGDAVWPEENFALTLWCEQEEAQAIERAVAKVKQRFPDEGIKLFGLDEKTN